MLFDGDLFPMNPAKCCPRPNEPGLRLNAGARREEQTNVPELPGQLFCFPGPGFFAFPLGFGVDAVASAVIWATTARVSLTRAKCRWRLGLVPDDRQPEEAAEKALLQIAAG
jgi:hypothetical protein